MVDQGILRVDVVKLSTKSKPQERTVNLRLPATESFSPEELSLIDSILAKFKDYDSDEISDLSHSELGWKLMAEEETIPYALAFYSNPPLTQQEIERGRQIAQSRRVA